MLCSVLSFLPHHLQTHQLAEGSARRHYQPWPLPTCLQEPRISPYPGQPFASSFLFSVSDFPVSLG